MLLHYFDVKKTAAETHHLLFKMYDDENPSERTCRVWFERFRSYDFDMRDKKCLGQPKKFKNVELQHNCIQMKPLQLIANSNYAN